MKNLFFLLLLPLLVFAQDSDFDYEEGKPIPKHIGYIKNFRGEVFKQKNGILVPVKKESRLYKEDTLITRDKSFAQIKIIDDTIINVNGNSELNFAEFRMINKKEREGTFHIVKGQIRAVVKNKAPKPDALLFKTKHAVLGVRGTELMVNFHSYLSHEVSEFALVEGLASVTDDKNQSVEIKKQDRVVIVREPVTHKSETKSLPLSYGMQTHLIQNPEEFLLPFNPETNTVDDPYASLQPPKERVKETVVNEPEKDDENVEGVDDKLKRLNEKLKSYQKR